MSTEREAPRRWQKLGDVDPEHLVDDRLQLHHAAQLLSAFGQTHLESRSDDSHRAMLWDHERGAFRSHVTTDGLELVLNVADLTVDLLGSAGVLASHPLRGSSLDEARTWLSQAVGGGGPEPAALSWPEYDLPTHDVARGAPFHAGATGLLELVGWYQNAWLLLDGLADRAEGASTILCWPHHFDLATLITVVPARGDSGARTVGVGMSPGDESSPAPYLYVNMWPHPEVDALPQIDGPGRWQTEGWIGAVLLAGEVVAAGEAEAQAERARRFVDTRVEVGRRLLLD